MCGFIARSCLHAEYDSHSTFPSSRISSSFSIVDAEINRNRCVWCFPVFQIDLFLTLTLLWHCVWYQARPRYGSGAVRYWYLVHMHICIQILICFSSFTFYTVFYYLCVVQVVHHTRQWQPSLISSPLRTLLCYVVSHGNLLKTLRLHVS